MKFSRKTAAILYFILILPLWFWFSTLPAPQTRELSGTGPCDLMGADFTQTVYVPVFWESYPEHLYTPADLDRGGLEAPRPSGDLDYRQVEYATHVMRLLLPPGETYGLSLRTADYSMRLFVNGKELDCVGSPGTTRAETLPMVRERLYAFIPQGEETTLVLQCANFVHHEGANPPPIKLGLFTVVDALATRDLVVAFTIVGCLSAAAIHHLALYLFSQGRRISLIFSLCCLLLIFVSDKTIVYLFPFLPWFWAIRLEYLTHFATFALLFYFLDTLHTGVFHGKITKAYYSFAVFYALTLFLDSTVFTKLLLGFEVVSIITILYILIQLARTLREGRIQNLLSFSGILVVSVLAINDILMRQGVRFLGDMVGQKFTAPIGMVFLVCCYTVVLAIETAERDKAIEETGRKIKEIEARYQALEAAESQKPRRATMADFGLSEQERNVSWLLMEGKTRKEIAHALDLGMGTVNTYCSRIYKKTQVGSLAELMHLFGMAPEEKD